MAHISDSGTGSKSGVKTPNRATVPAPSGCQAFRSDPAVFAIVGTESKVPDPRPSALRNFLLFITAPPYKSTRVSEGFPFRCPTSQYVTRSLRAVGNKLHWRSPPIDGQAGSYRFVRRIGTDKRPCVYQLNSTCLVSAVLVHLTGLLAQPKMSHTCQARTRSLERPLRTTAS